MYQVPSERPYLLARTTDKFIFVEYAVHFLSCQLHHSGSTVHGMSSLHVAHICRVLNENIDKLSINNIANAITHIVAAAVASVPEYDGRNYEFGMWRFFSQMKQIVYS